MTGRNRDAGGESANHRRAVSVLAVVLAIVVVAAAGCSGQIVNDDEARPTIPTTTSAPPPLSSPSTNDDLANAFDFAAQPNGDTAYYFTSPSKRWACAVVPRESAGCQSSSGSTIPITGAPDTVPGPQGSDVAPNAVEVGVRTDPQFTSLDAPGYALVPGPATVLPFGKVLAVAGFRCNVQEATGISCASEVSGKGFTFSADGFTPRYTDLPA